MKQLPKTKIINGERYTKVTGLVANSTAQTYASKIRGQEGYKARIVPIGSKYVVYKGKRAK